MLDAALSENLRGVKNIALKVKKGPSDRD